MTTKDWKAHVNQRFAELKEDNPSWSRVKITNLILEELFNEFNVKLTTPTGHPIVSVMEDSQGIVYEVTNLVG